MVGEQINIIRATIKDAQLLSDLSNVTFIETYRGSGSDEDLLAFMDEYFSEAIIEEELKDPADNYYLAFINDMPAG